jgi:hypothetical protein
MEMLPRHCNPCQNDEPFTFCVANLVRSHTCTRSHSLSGCALRHSIHSHSRTRRHPPVITCHLPSTFIIWRCASRTHALLCRLHPAFLPEPAHMASSTCGCVPHSTLQCFHHTAHSVCLLSRSNTSIWVVRSANEAKVIARRYLLYTRHTDHPSSIQPELSPSLREAALRRVGGGAHMVSPQRRRNNCRLVCVATAGERTLSRSHLSWRRRGKCVPM